MKKILSIIPWFAVGLSIAAGVLEKSLSDKITDFFIATILTVFQIGVEVMDRIALIKSSWTSTTTEVFKDKTVVTNWENGSKISEKTYLHNAQA